MQNVNRSLAKTGKKLQGLGKGLSVGLTAPLVGFGALAVSKFAEFEDQMAKVKAISGATASEFKLLTENAKKLGETTRFTAAEVGGLQLNFSKLGFKPDEILKATEATLDLALATGEDLAQSATIAASTLRGFGLDASETQRVTDVMAASFSASSLDLAKFETAMSVLAPVAKNAGVSLEDATGQLAVLTNAGIDASTAGTGLRNIYLDLAGSGETLEGALSKISGSTNKNATAFELFGKRGATVAAVLADNFTQANQLGESFRGSAGAASEMAAIMDNTAKGALARLNSAFEGVAISIGEQIAPILLKVAEFVGQALNKFNQLSPSIKKVVVILGGIAAAIGPLLLLAGTILPAIGTGFALLTGPIGLVVAGLAAIAVVVVKNWKPIKKIVLDIVNYFVDLYNESVVVRAGVQAIAFQFKNIFSVAVFVFDALSSVMQLFVDQVKTGFTSVGKVVKGALTFDYDLIKEGLSDAFSGASQNVGTFVKNIKGDFTKLGASISDNITGAIDNVTKRKKIEFVKENVDAKPVEDKVKNAVQTGATTGLGNALKGLGSKKLTALQKIEADIELDDLEDVDTSTFEGLDLSLKIDQAQTDLFSNIISEDFNSALEAVDEGTEAYAEKAERLKEIGASVGESVGSAFESLSGRVVDSLGLADEGFQGFIKGLLGTITKLISMMLAQSIAQSIAGATASGAATGPGAIFTTPAFIATAVGGVLAAFAAIPKFETGGVVGGSSFFGDKILARVNSGELILNQKQQASLFGQMSGGDSNINLNGGFRVTGDQLQLVLDRSSNNKSRRS